MEMASVSTEFDIFALKPMQQAIHETIEVTYKPIATIDQTDLEFNIPADTDTYVDTNIHLYVSGKLTTADGKDLNAEDFTAVTNNFLHSLFSQCTIYLNGVPITQSSQHYNYRSTLETLLSYGNDAVHSHLTNAFWYPDTGDMSACCPATVPSKNTGFVRRWNLCKQSKEIQMYGRLHADICNVPRFLLPGVRMQVKLTKAKPRFYLMHTDPEHSTVFKFLDAKLYVKRVRVNPALLMAQNETLKHGALSRYNLTRVELKSFTFSSGAQSLSIDNAVLGRIPKRLLFTMLKNTDFLGSMDSNPYNFRHYDMTNFSLFVNGKQYPNEGLSMDMSHEKSSVLAYNTLFEGSGIHHSNAGLQITHDMYINGYFMLLFDLTPDRAASEGHVSPPDNGVVRIECKFARPLPEPITCLLYLEYENSVLGDYSRTVSTDF